MNNENINENEQNLNDIEFDALVNKIKRHSINKKHSPERLNNIVLYALEENQNYEKERKNTLAYLTQKTKQSKAKEFLANLIGWGRPKVLIPRLAFLTSILIIISVSIFYLSSPQSINKSENIVSITKEEVNKQDEQKAESNQTEIKSTQEINKLQDESNISSKSQHKSNKLYFDRKSTLTKRTEPPTDSSLISQANLNNSLRRMPDAPLKFTNTNRGFDYLNHHQVSSFDTILETIVDTERGSGSFRLLQKGSIPKGDTTNLNFKRYIQILNNYQITYFEKDNEIVTNWFYVKSNNFGSPYLRLFFKCDPSDLKNIQIIKESTQQISDTTNIRILTEKEYNRLINLIK